MALKLPADQEASERCGPAPKPLGAGYRGQFRRYQTLALEAFEAAWSQGRERCYVVMPPGSGKSLLGLEIARRVGRKTVIFGPNTAIQAQWAKEWNDFAPPTPAGTSPRLQRQLNVLTYQSLCNLERAAGLDELAGANNAILRTDAGADEDIGEENAHPAAPLGRRELSRLAADRRRRRRLIARGGDREALLGLLHPNGRKLIERMKAAGQLTLILDECHHLLEMWGSLVQALVDELGDGVFVVGLTATPPAEMGVREARLYLDLFGHADFEVPTPAVVKEGELAPYQALAYVTEPLPHEREYMAAQAQRFEDLTHDLLDPSFASRPFLDWIHTRIVERASTSGAQVGWGRLEADEPDLATAALRLFLSRGLATPPEAHIGERHRQPPDADDWAVLIEDYCRSFLGDSEDPRDQRAWQRIRRAMPSVGYILTPQGIRSYVSPSDRVLALSASKAAATQTILDLERHELGADLRALVLCDFERAGVELLAELRDVLDPQAGSASLILQLLVSDARTRALGPILLTGRTVACSSSTASKLIRWLAGEVPDIASALSSMPRGSPKDGIVVVAPKHTWWQPRNYVPLVTRYFEEGRSRCLIGTRGLLGEGWNALSVNVLVDLTAATTSTSVHQMRGRSLRLDPNLPRKVADNWDVVCLASDDPKGQGDYERFVRKHHSYYALTAGGEIECGVSHVDPVLSPFGPPPATEIPNLNHRNLERIARREEAYLLWGIGQPYRNVEIASVRVHSNLPLGVPRKAVGATDKPKRSYLGQALFEYLVMLSVCALAMLLMMAYIFVDTALGPVAAVFATAGLALLMAGAFAAARLARRLRAWQKWRRPSATLEAIAAAVAEALAATGGTDRRLGPSTVRVVIQPDGFYRCYLEGASLRDSQVYAEAMDQILAPIEDPRYIIPRQIVDPPTTRRAVLRLSTRVGLGRTDGRRVYHAVPDYLAANRGRVKQFERAWARHLGQERALYSGDPKAVGIIAVAQGENPFATTTQLRTLWS